MTLAARLAEFARSAKPSPAAQQIARLSLVDWAACGIAGAEMPVARILRAQLLEEGGATQASGFATQDKLPARAAALLNGAASHALDYDDTHFAHIGHPSVAVFPAALAISEHLGATGAEMLDAALIGMEASIRLGLWFTRAHYEAGFHQTATAGAFGATLAAGRLIGLASEPMSQALGLCATRAAGLKSQFGTMGKPYNAGLAAETGVSCANLAAKWFQSNPAALEGPQGFGPTHHGAGAASAFDRIGEYWIFETVSHKFHACCHGTHAMLEALRGLDASDAIKIEVQTHPRWMQVCNQQHPQTGLAAKFSYRFLAALAITGHDTARLATYDDALCRDPDLIAWHDRVRVVARDDLSEMQARVILRNADGAERVGFHDLDQAIPLAEREARIAAKGAALLGRDRAAALRDAVMSPAGPDQDRLIALIAAPHPAGRASR